jgi:outer membrane protein OmpA-like peptidoglycan-associated protein
MPGYYISAYTTLGFSSYDFETKPSKTTVEGKYYKIAYYRENGVENPGGLAIQRNYMNAIRMAGGVVVHQDENNVIMKAARNGVEIWARLQAGLKYQGNYYWLYLVERVPMKQVITADTIGEAIDRDGFIALDIHFATGKAEILEESIGAVNEIAVLLAQRKGLSVIVEGHTDNTGTPEGNKALSDARAKSVVAALTAKGVAAARLTATGFGQEQPVAPNTTEEGRAKNRRVVVRRK